MSPALLAALLVGCPTPPTTLPEAVGKVCKGSGVLNGYLDRSLLPDRLALLPPPPAPGSAQANAEMDNFQRARAPRDTPRWALATNDAQLKFPAAASTFECALQAPISEQGTPNLYMLLRRMLADAGLAKDGSYPSGRASAGRAWVRVLVQAAPQCSHAFGFSRVICGVHWRSDVDAGRLIGAAAVARLQSDETFRAQRALAREEFARAQARSLKPSGDCAAQAAALR